MGPFEVRWPIRQVMDANKARELSFHEFSNSVEAEVEKILSEIKLNLRRGQLDYLIIGAEGDGVDISTFRTPPHSGYARILRERHSDKPEDLLNIIVETTLSWDQQSLQVVEWDLSFGQAIRIEIRLLGYETEWCDNHCCTDEPSDDRHIWIHWGDSW